MKFREFVFRGAEFGLTGVKKIAQETLHFRVSCVGERELSNHSGALNLC